jgi:hypothetical protein
MAFFMNKNLSFALAVAVLICSARATNHFRGGEATTGTVSSQEVESSVKASLESASRGDAGAQQVSRIETSLWPTFQALPKNSMGRLAPRAVRYAVHNYFQKEHGWQIKGLEPQGMQMNNTTEVHEVTILQDKAPALVEALLETRRSDDGLPFGDVVVMVAALERLIFEESFKLLEAAYTLNGVSATDQIEEESLHDVLLSYLLVFELGVKGNLSDTVKHQKMKKVLAKASGNGWRALSMYEQDATLNFMYAKRMRTNPFRPQTFTFDEATEIVESMAQSYGKWQNSECLMMKDELMGLDPNGLGRVPLSAFYGQPEGAAYQLTESVEYLKQVGALDESSHEHPQVLIANYMAGPSNCIASSTYYSVCCLSECDGLMNEIEGKVQAPTVSPGRLLHIVGNLSSSTVDAPRQLDTFLTEKLNFISERNGGEVPLHGRLFAQWLHHSFPNECPYPQIAENTAALTPGHWVNKAASAPKEVRQQHIDSMGDAKPVIELSNVQWSDDEVLPLIEPRTRNQFAILSIVRMGMQLAMVCVVLRGAVAAFNLAMHGPGCSGPKKDKEFELPF